MVKIQDQWDQVQVQQGWNKHLKLDKLMPRKRHKLLQPKTLQFWVTMNLKESRVCAHKRVILKTTTPWGKMKELNYNHFLTTGFPNGQILSMHKEKERNMKELKSWKMMRLKEEESMPMKNLINKSWDKVNLIKQTKCSTITKIWLRLFIQKC